MNGGSLTVSQCTCRRRQVLSVRRWVPRRQAWVGRSCNVPTMVSSFIKAVTTQLLTPMVGPCWAMLSPGMMLWPGAAGGGTCCAGASCASLSGALVATSLSAMVAVWRLYAVKAPGHLSHCWAARYKRVQLRLSAGLSSQHAPPAFWGVT